MTSIRFRCRAKTTDDFRTISLQKDGSVVCDCDGFHDYFCSHIDATLIAGERFMVPETDRRKADKAMALVSETLKTPPNWRGAWRRNSSWRGLPTATGPRIKVDLREDFGDDYYSRPKVCFTGNGPSTRQEMIQSARAHGWQAVDTFQLGTKVLVAEDPTQNSKKLQRARSSAIPILSYDEWADLNSDGELG